MNLQPKEHRDTILFAYIKKDNKEFLEHASRITKLSLSELTDQIIEEQREVFENDRKQKESKNHRRRA